MSWKALRSKILHVYSTPTPNTPLFYLLYYKKKQEGKPKKFFCSSVSSSSHSKHDSYAWIHINDCLFSKEAAPWLAWRENMNWHGILNSYFMFLPTSLALQRCMKIILTVFIDKICAGKSVWFKIRLMQLGPTYDYLTADLFSCSV